MPQEVLVELLFLTHTVEHRQFPSDLQANRLGPRVRQLLIFAIVYTHHRYIMIADTYFTIPRKAEAGLTYIRTVA